MADDTTPQSDEDVELHRKGAGGGQHTTPVEPPSIARSDEDEEDVELHGGRGLGGQHTMPVEPPSVS